MAQYKRKHDEDDELFLSEDGELPADLAPDTDPDYARRYQEALKQVKRIKEFYVHVAVYIAVNAFLMVINMLTGDFPWFIFPLGGWGIGLIAHAFDVYGTHGVFGQEWEDRKIRQLMGEKHKRDR
jgi:hypothetical protein